MKVFYLILVIILIKQICLKVFKSNLKANALTAVDLENVRKNILKDHNYHRKRHQVGDLVRNSEIESIAQTYTEKIANSGNVKHSNNQYKGRDLGENLFWYFSGSVTLTGTDASQSWYNEVEYYDFNNPGFTNDVGHFTQLVWKGSNQIGCGAHCGVYCVITCNYYPAGNYLNDFANNVFPEKEEESDDKSKKNYNKKGMSTAGKVFLSIFIILIFAVICFSIYHFVFKKRKFYELKVYFKM